MTPEAAQIQSAYIQSVGTVLGCVLASVLTLYGKELKSFFKKTHFAS